MALKCLIQLGYKSQRLSVYIVSYTRQNSHEIYMIDLWYSHELLSACYETRVMVKSLGVHRVWKCHELESQGHHRFHGLWKSYDSLCTLWKFSDHCFIGYEIPMILPVSHEIWFHWPWNTYEFSQHMQCTWHVFESSCFSFQIGFRVTSKFSSHSRCSNQVQWWIKGHVATPAGK